MTLLKSYQCVVSLYNHGKFDDVLSQCSKLISEFPNTFDFYNLKGLYIRKE